MPGDKDGDEGVAAGANERSEELIQSMDILLLLLTFFIKSLSDFQLSMDIDVCEATSEEDCESESELDSDEISEDEDGRLQTTIDIKIISKIISNHNVC